MNSLLKGMVVGTVPAILVGSALQAQDVQDAKVAPPATQPTTQPTTQPAPPLPPIQAINGKRG